MRLVYEGVEQLVALPVIFVPSVLFVWIYGKLFKKQYRFFKDVCVFALYPVAVFSFLWISVGFHMDDILMAWFLLALLLVSVPIVRRLRGLYRSGDVAAIKRSRLRHAVFFGPLFGYSLIMLLPVVMGQPSTDGMTKAFEGRHVQLRLKDRFNDDINRFEHVYEDVSVQEVQVLSCQRRNSLTGALKLRSAYSCFVSLSISNGEMAQVNLYVTKPFGIGRPWFITNEDPVTVYRPSTDPE